VQAADCKGAMVVSVYVLHFIFLAQYTVLSFRISFSIRISRFSCRKRFRKLYYSFRQFSWNRKL